jgi:hypothetical protein
MKSLLATALISFASIASTDALTLKESGSKVHSTFVKIEAKGRAVYQSVQFFEDAARAAVVKHLTSSTRPEFGFTPTRPVTAPKKARTFIDPESETDRVVVNFYEGSQGVFAVRFSKDGTIAGIQKRGQ